MTWFYNGTDFHDPFERFGIYSALWPDLPALYLKRSAYRSTARRGARRIGHEQPAKSRADSPYPKVHVYQLVIVALVRNLICPLTRAGSSSVLPIADTPAEVLAAAYFRMSGVVAMTACNEPELSAACMRGVAAYLNSTIANDVESRADAAHLRAGTEDLKSFMSCVGGETLVSLR